jgi:transcriptional regulator with XRE-family HTH domain
MSDPVPVLARAVRMLRERLGLTQAQFAKKLGKHTTTVVRYETSRPPTGPILLALADLAREARILALEGCFMASFDLSKKTRDPSEIDAILSGTAGPRKELYLLGGPKGMSTVGASLDLLSAGGDFRIEPITTRTIQYYATYREWQWIQGLLTLLRSEDSDTKQKLVEIVAAALRGFIAEEKASEDPGEPTR